MPGQLEAYYEALQTAPARRTRLVLLTRSLAWGQQTTLSPECYHHVCWYQEHDWLTALATCEEVCDYLVQGFMSFLEAKHTSVDKVTWEYMQGVPGMLRLTEMLHMAIAEACPKMHIKRTAGWSWRGFYLSGSLFCGIRYVKPLLVVCEDNNGNELVTYKRDFDLEKEHFFSLSAGEQLERLTQHVKDAVGNAPAPAVSEPAAVCAALDEETVTEVA
jgi:hypothetical protein